MLRRALESCPVPGGPVSGPYPHPGRWEPRASSSNSSRAATCDAHGSGLRAGRGVGTSVWHMPYTNPISALLAYLLLVACQTPGRLVDLPHIKNRERSPPRISQCRLSTDAKYTEVFAFSKFHTNIQKYLHLCNKGKGFALRHRPPLQMAVELAAGPGS